MNLRLKQNTIEWSFVAALIVFCVALTALQYRWTGELARAAMTQVRSANAPDLGRGPLWSSEIHRLPDAVEALVAASRRRNLALAVLLNGLILVAGLALLRHTRRSRRLAAAQMRFVADVSHELRTPLTVIRGAAHNLGRGVVHEPARREQYVQLIAQHAEQLSEMVEQVLTFASTKKKELQFSRETVQLREALQGAITAAALDPQVGQCEISLDAPRDLPLVSGDSTALRRAFQNLIANAGKHGGDGRWIGVSAKTVVSGGTTMIEVRVTDRGPGIPEREQARIFEPFVRGAAAQSRQVRGSGLGLSLVREIVGAHGGTVSVSSESGRGAVFTILLPIEAVRHADELAHSSR